MWKTSRSSYWAIRPKNIPKHIRIEKALSAKDACNAAFGFNRGLFEAKNLGTRVAVIQSDKQRIALLTDPLNWEEVK